MLLNDRQFRNFLFLMCAFWYVEDQRLPAIAKRRPIVLSNHRGIQLFIMKFFHEKKSNTAKKLQPFQLLFLQYAINLFC